MGQALVLVPQLQPLSLLGTQLVQGSHLRERELQKSVSDAHDIAEQSSPVTQALPVLAQVASFWIPHCPGPSPVLTSLMYPASPQVVPQEFFMIQKS